MTLLGQQDIRSSRAPSARGIKLTLVQRFLSPSGSDRIDYAPSNFHHIPSDEKGRITSHRIEQQALVSLRSISAKLALIIELHSDWPQLSAGAGNLTVKP